MTPLPALAGAAMLAIAAALAGIVAWRFAHSIGRRYHTSIGRIAREGLADAFIFVDPRVLLRWTLVAAAAAAALVAMVGGALPLAIGTGGVVLAVPRWMLRHLTAKRRRQLRAQLPDVLVALAAALRAGLGLSQALATIALDQPRPIAEEFALVARKQRLGTPLDTAIAELAVRVPVAEFVLFCTALRIANESGGSLAEALDRLADTVRRRIALEEKIEALTAQGRLQGIVVGVLPLALMAILTVMEPRAMHSLFSTPIGWATLAVVAMLEVLGAYLIRRIVRIDV
jgi:tight adherence protein B